MGKFDASLFVSLKEYFAPIKGLGPVSVGVSVCVVDSKCFITNNILKITGE
ncbi:MAG: hypothetical protein JWO06_3925 [Bacteroidota bacterium]|nr:hypothetical protein [Bacteroidota bacterium]